MPLVIRIKREASFIEEENSQETAGQFSAVINRRWSYVGGSRNMSGILKKPYVFGFWVDQERLGSQLGELHNLYADKC